MYIIPKNKGLNTGARERRGRTVRSVASEPIYIDLRGKTREYQRTFLFRLLRKAKSPAWGKMNQHQREEWIKRAASKTYEADQ
jgi:hypothetical protein